MYKFILTIGYIIISINVLSQSRPVIHCATMEQDSINRVLYPQLGELNDFERALQNKIKEIKERNKTKRTHAEVLTIPIIVHIVHKGEQVGTGSNLSAEQVQAQIDVLNEDFRKQAGTNGENSNPVGADIEIEFCLAQIGKDGKTLSEKGIHRYNGNKDKWTRSEIEGTLKPNTTWDSDKYYNIWTLDFGGTDANILGYAQFPSQSNLSGLPENGGPASTDGVVVSYRHFGSAQKGNFPVLEAPYNKGRTLTHETGHYLGLRHIWGDGGCSADDFVGDTPPADRESRGCEKGRTSCNSVNMVENYMDYSEDGCMNIFTNGQKTRMRAVMELSPRRSTLPFANVCSPTVDAPPVANFRANKTVILRGASVTFNDLSSNFPASWKWTFEGGEPSSSTARNPKIKYSVADTFNVSLIATNSLGSDTILREGYIIVSPQGICSDTTNFKGTPTLLPVPVDGENGYLAGHNSLKHKAKAEYFDNKLGYAYINRARLRFGHAYSEKEDATVKITVWNARGPQGAPGAILEETEVLIKKIKEDIDNNRATEVLFTRVTPVFERGFYVGIQLNYDGDTVGLITTQDGESLISTAWQQDAEGKWEAYTIAYGINVAHDITPTLGMNPAVQISSSALYIQPGEKITMNGKGASVFAWTSSDGKINSLGPQLIVYPYETTTYTLAGSGLELCDSTATFTVFVNKILGSNEAIARQVKVYPNPARSKVKLELNNQWIGKLNIELINSLGQTIVTRKTFKNQKEFTEELEVKQFENGVYILQFMWNNNIVKKKLIINK